jgi:hypothetical protein
MHFPVAADRLFMVRVHGSSQNSTEESLNKQPDLLQNQKTIRRLPGK